MEIPNYDNWKTMLPDEQEPADYCDICGEPVYEGEYITDILGEKWCDECLNERLRRML
mgnify:FL=1